MKLEPANIVCPACGNPNYMRHLIGKNVGHLDLKCINCNSYFNFEELYKQRIGETLKPKHTNANRIRSMSDEELADFLYKYLDCTDCPIECNPGKDICLYKIMEWLKKESE